MPAAVAPYSLYRPLKKRPPDVFSTLTLILMSTLTQDPSNDKDTPLSQVERKNRAPVSPEMLRVSLPKPFETRLANGLTVMILEDHRTPVVTAELTSTEPVNSSYR